MIPSFDEIEEHAIEPVGVDAVHLPASIEVARQLPVGDLRAAQKARYGGEPFPAEVAAEPGGTPFVEFFQRDRLTRSAKGIIAIDIGALG